MVLSLPTWVCYGVPTLSHVIIVQYPCFFLGIGVSQGLSGPEQEADMKHKVKMMVETEKQGLFGKKKVLQERTVEVDSITYQKMQKEMKHRSLSFEEIMWLDELLDEDE